MFLSFFASPSVLHLDEVIFTLHLGLLFVVFEDANHRCILTLAPGAQTHQQHFIANLKPRG